MSMTAANSNNAGEAKALSDYNEYVTVMVADQIFGLADRPRARCLHRERRHRGAPGAARRSSGLLNLRGRVVTAMCLRRRLGLPDAAEGREMAVGLEQQGESYGLLVDQVGEVMKLSADTREPNPVHMDPALGPS